ncbi:MAG: hypothetical protein M0038_04905 [Pseudomonadota bacterium]|jgi:metal-responsive CopG/Arc/MetJ family transcriptional regulator|nr:hypothetical protein [Pseudomonadota bacterium]
MKSQTTAARVTLSLPPQTRQRLDAFAAAERRSRSNAVAVLLDAVLRRSNPQPSTTAPAGAE